MPYCRDCASYTGTSAEAGDCRINGDVPGDRESERCPSRTFVPRPAPVKKGR